MPDISAVNLNFLEYESCVSFYHVMFSYSAQ